VVPVYPDEQLGVNRILLVDLTAIWSAGAAGNRDFAVVGVAKYLNALG
jgi:hypothetical protein